MPLAGLCKVAKCAPRRARRRVSPAQSPPAARRPGSPPGRAVETRRPVRKERRMSTVRARRRRARARRPREEQGQQGRTLGNRHSEASPLRSVRGTFEATRGCGVDPSPARTNRPFRRRYLAESLPRPEVTRRCGPARAAGRGRHGHLRQGIRGRESEFLMGLFGARREIARPRGI